MIDLKDIDWSKVDISVDVSTNDEDFENRIFAKCIDVQISKDGKITLLCEEVERNF